MLCKLFNFPTVFQKTIIANELSFLEDLATLLAIKRNEDNREKEKLYNSKCFLCKGTNVVNKVPKDHLINHCNDCGNEWERPYLGTSCQKTIIVEWLTEVSNSFSFTYPLAKGVVSSLKETLPTIHAETIKRLSSKYISGAYYPYTIIRANLTLTNIRTKYKSIYDEN